nr:hypothetical protein [Nitrosomonas nitrosa]
MLSARGEITHEDREKVIDAVELVIRGPLNTSEVAEIFLALWHSKAANGDTLIDEDFASKAFGWPPKTAKRLAALYEEGRWAEVKVGSENFGVSVAGAKTAVPLRNALENKLSEVSDVDGEQKDKLLNLVEVIVRSPLKPQTVGAEFHTLWHLRSEIDEKELDKIIGHLLHLTPRKARSLAIAFEDRWMAQQSNVQGGARGGKVESTNAGQTGTGDGTTLEVDDQKSDDDTRSDDANTHHSKAAGDEKDEAAEDAEGSTMTGKSGPPPESNEPLDENDDSESTPDHEASSSDGEDNPPPDGAESGEQARPLEVIDPGGSRPPRKKGKKSGVGSATAEHDNLSDQERTTLNHCLEVIHKGMNTFVQVGSAIATLIVQRLYRETHPTFSRYANEILGISPRRAYQLKDASDVIDNLKKANNCSHEYGGPAELPLPTNENQVRALKNFPPDVQREIWREAVKVAGDNVTAKVLAQVIKARPKNTDGSAAEDAQDKKATNVGSAFEEEIEKVIATLNRAWKALAQEHHSTFLDRVSEWMTSAGEGDSAS